MGVNVEVIKWRCDNQILLTQTREAEISAIYKSYDR